ncbi:dynamin GTPase [Lecanosticta acicola]|uniref:Dynamin GTPase n=1 Tax=Lecanosticta acicola TaxID=111012 RepID=A0AAI9EEG5_9PEZI|nr:dynamin GTPase [Lecanosticta acicola]
MGEGIDMPNGTAAAAARDVDNIAQMLATASLDDLQSREYRQILDVVDRLRTCGLGSILPLPQLVVCGNQSSGKSSVLEAITEVPFPRKENLCTRFATEIILRRDQIESIHTKIIPDDARPESEKSKLKAFSESITDFKELPLLIEKATELMGLNDPAGGENSTRAFTRDVLSVEIAGPGRPQLTLVDLPGLIMSASKMQSEADVKLIHSLVGDYLAEKRTIMLADISAKDDYANQGILTKCKEVDKDGHRTLGIITKPDFLIEGSGNQTTWINLAHNKDIYFEIGWHMLKNRSDQEIDTPFEERNQSERNFFSRGRYRDLPETDKGVISLRTKLSKLLFKHLKKELPNLQAELNSKHARTAEALEQLGEKRSTLAEQRRFLMNIAAAFQSTVNSAAAGHYESHFFGPIDPSKGFEEMTNMKRLRAAVQYHNLQFASQMRQYGHKFRIWATEDAAGTNSKKDLPEPELIEEYQGAKDLQKTVSRKDAVTWVKDILVRTKGRELSGNFNPLLMSQLFWEQSENWENLASVHIDRIDALCCRFIEEAIKAVTLAFPDVATRLLALRLEDALKTRLSNARQELQRLIQDKQRPPITYNPSYTAAIQESRSQKAKAKIMQLMDQAKVDNGDGDSVINPELLYNQLKELTEPDMDKNSSEDALDSQLAYYKDKVTYFIAAVTDQVIERNLLHGLAEETLSPLIINDLPAEAIEYIAAEAEEITHKRQFLEGHKAILESGQDAEHSARRWARTK